MGTLRRYDWRMLALSQQANEGESTSHYTEKMRATIKSVRSHARRLGTLEDFPGATQNLGGFQSKHYRARAQRTGFGYQGKMSQEGLAKVPQKVDPYTGKPVGGKP